MTNINLLHECRKVIENNFFNNSPTIAIIWKNDDRWNVEAVSKNITKLLAYKESDFINNNIIYSDLIHPADLKRVTSEVSTSLENKEIEFSHKPYRIKDCNGIYKWLNDKTTIIYENDKVTHFIGYLSDCTEQQEISQQLKESRQMWVNAIEKNGDGLWKWNIISNEVYFSSQWKKMLGFKDNEISNSLFEWEKRIHPDDVEEVTKDINDYLEGKTNQYINEHRVLCKDGSYKWILDRGVATKYTSDRKIEVITGTHRDITETKKLKQQLEQSIVYNRTLIDNLPFLIWLKDIDSNFLAVNDSFAKATTLQDPKLIIGKNDFDVWSEELAKQYVADDKLVLNKKNVKLVREEITDGNIKKWFEIFKAPVFDKKDKLLGTIGYAMDISESLKIQEKLKLQNEQLSLEKTKLSTIVHALPDLLWIKDINGKYLACNRRFEDFFGAKESEIIGKTDYDFVDSSLADFFRENDLKAMKSDVALSNYEEVPFASDGHKEYLHTTKVKVLSHDGTIYGVLGIGRDITQIKRYQTQIEVQKEEFETIFNSSKDGIAIIDLDSNFLNCNQSYCEMLEYSKEELLTKSCIELAIPEDRKKFIEVIQQTIEEGFVTNFEKRCVTKNNKKIYVNMTASFLPDKKRILLISKDVSGIKLLEEQSKLVAMGEMIGNIAHQWRQPLSIISTIATGISFQKELGILEDEYLIKQMKMINDSAQYLSKTIDDFRNFVKNDKIVELISIKKSIEYTIHLTEASIKNNFINLVTNLDADLQIHANKNELVQSFMNIINNAKDILIANKEEKDRFIFIETKLIKDRLELKISDTGGGIPEDIIERIFEPYFTTKHKSMGTGIGLSIVNTILKNKYKAEIIVSNEDIIHNNITYHGASFKIIFNKV